MRRLQTDEYAPVLALLTEHQENLNLGLQMLTALEANRVLRDAKNKNRLLATQRKYKQLGLLDSVYVRLSDLIDRSLGDTLLGEQLSSGKLPRTIDEKRERYFKVAENLKALTEESRQALQANFWSTTDETLFLTLYQGFEDLCQQQEQTLTEVKIIDEGGRNQKQDLIRWYVSIRKTVLGLRKFNPELTLLLDGAFPVLKAMKSSSKNSSSSQTPGNPPDTGNNGGNNQNPPDTGNTGGESPGAEPPQGNGSSGNQTQGDPPRNGASPKAGVPPETGSAPQTGSPQPGQAA